MATAGIASDLTLLALPDVSAAGWMQVEGGKLLPPTAQFTVPGSGAVRRAGTSALWSWPLVKCNHCDTVTKWRNMRSEKVWERFQETLQDQDDAFHWVYTCVVCLSKELNCTEKEAKIHIMSALENPRWARERNVKYRTAFESRKADCMGVSRSGIRFLAMRDITELLSPLGEFVARKLCQLQARRKGIEEYDKLLVELREVKDKEKELTIIEELERWDKSLEELNKPMAFADKEDAVQMFNVAQYSDEWVRTASGALRAWYVCLQDWGGQHPPCGTVMPSKQWKRKFADLGSTKQRWYCVCCQTRFRTSYGMLVEVHTKGVSTFMLAEVSNRDVEDVRAMYLDRTLKPKDHMDLWRQIPDFTPIDPRDILRPVADHELSITGGYDKDLIMKFVDVQGLKSVPKWDWDQILCLIE